MFKAYLFDQSGATAIEYGLITATMGLCLVTVMPKIKTALTLQFTSLGTHITSGK